jgi:hypothetical protein
MADAKPRRCRASGSDRGCSFDKIRAVTRVATPADDELWARVALHASGGQLARICRDVRLAFDVDDPRSRKTTARCQGGPKRSALALSCHGELKERPAVPGRIGEQAVGRHPQGDSREMHDEVATGVRVAVAIARGAPFETAIPALGSVDPEMFKLAVPVIV